MHRYVIVNALPKFSLIFLFPARRPTDFAFFRTAAPSENGFFRLFSERDEKKRRVFSGVRVQRNAFLVIFRKHIKYRKMKNIGKIRRFSLSLKIL